MLNFKCCQKSLRKYLNIEMLCLSTVPIISQFFISCSYEVIINCFISSAAVLEPKKFTFEFIFALGILCQKREKKQVSPYDLNRHEISTDRKNLNIFLKRCNQRKDIFYIFNPLLQH